MDGRVRIWFFDTIDQADPPDNDRFVEACPTYDIYYTEIMFMCAQKMNYDPKNTFYYVQVSVNKKVLLNSDIFKNQDGKGGLWRVQINNDERHVAPAEQLYKCHAGAVVDIGACPCGPYLASLGIDGRLQLYNYEQKKILFRHTFPAKGSVLIWLPLNVSKIRTYD